MPETAIRIQHLSKAYRLYAHPLDRIKEVLHPRGKKYHRLFYALDDISFELQAGQTLGLIGANGSGKSTLLKILASVLTPTAGTLHTQGRVAALLELGSGFNPELTGLQNVYFYGAIMGLSQAEADALLPGILDFADIGPFIHQPVKQYSSGMYVRLAFSVAIQLKPDILLIDEALSVGDVRFQQKCFRKIREIRETGCTIVFCSHDTRAVRNFCDQVIWLEKGCIKAYGPTRETMDAYQLANFWDAKAGDSPKASFLEDQLPPTDGLPPALVWHSMAGHESYGSGQVRLLGLGLPEEVEVNLRRWQGGETFTGYVWVQTQQGQEDIFLGMYLMDQVGNMILGVNNWVYEQVLHLSSGFSVIRISFELPRLANGPYALSLGVSREDSPGVEMLHFVHDCMVLEFSAIGTRQHYSGQVLPTKASFSVVD
jgi:ABC-type polysaccharide/polyol phosphate transport system ATPase subunit